MDTYRGKLWSYLFLTVVTTLNGLDTTRRAHSMYPSMLLVQSPMSDTINYVSSEFRNASWGGRHIFHPQTVQKIVFQDGLTANVPITGSSRSEIVGITSCEALGES